MHFLSAAVFITSASAAVVTTLHRRSAEMALAHIMERQYRECPREVPAPGTCEEACGPGYIQCVYPQRCYNPVAGNSCCSNGRYCPPGTYCTDRICCPNGFSLADCRANIRLSVIPPPVAESSTAPPGPSSSAVTYETTSTIEETSLYTSTDTITYEIASTTEEISLYTSTEATTYTDTAVSTEFPIYTTTTEHPTYPVTTEYPAPSDEILYSSLPPFNTTATSNVTASLVPPPQVTVNAGRVLDAGVAPLGISGLGFLFMLL